MPIVSKDEFLQQDDSEYAEVEIPAWGTIRLKSLTGRARDHYYNRQFIDREGQPDFSLEDSAARLLALSLCDDDGKPWFPDPEKGVRILREKSAGALQKAFEAALKLNGLTVEDVEEAAENLDGTQNDATGSA